MHTGGLAFETNGNFLGVAVHKILFPLTLECFPSS